MTQNKIKNGSGKTAKDEQIVINDIRIQQTDRSKKSIAGWRNDHRAAESITNPNRSRLYDLYADILLDGHLSGIIQKRIDAVLNKQLCYYTPDGQKVEKMDKHLHSAAFREIKLMIMETLLWGVSGIEFIPGRELQFVPIPRKHIKPEAGVISLEQHTSSNGIPYNEQPMLWIIHANSSAKLSKHVAGHSLGLLLKCAPYVIYKRDVMADWANYTEVYGQPVRIIKYDAYDEQTRIELKRILDESGSSLALMIPKQADFEMKDGKQTNGDGQLQERFKNSLNQELSVIILGNTETTSNSGNGSQAKSIVHQEQQEKILRSDLEFAIAQLNEAHFMDILQSYGWPLVKGGYFAFHKQADINYLAERIAVDKELASIVPISDDYFYETYGIPRPTNYAQLKEQITAEATQTTTESNFDKKTQIDDIIKQNNTGRMNWLVNLFRGKK